MKAIITYYAKDDDGNRVKKSEQIENVTNIEPEGESMAINYGLKGANLKYVKSIEYVDMHK